MNKLRFAVPLEPGKAPRIKYRSTGHGEMTWFPSFLALEGEQCHEPVVWAKAWCLRVPGPPWWSTMDQVTKCDSRLLLWNRGGPKGWKLNTIIQHCHPTHMPQIWRLAFKREDLVGENFGFILGLTVWEDRGVLILPPSCNLLGLSLRLMDICWEGKSVEGNGYMRGSSIQFLKSS